MTLASAWPFWQHLGTSRCAAGSSLPHTLVTMPGEPYATTRKSEAVAFDGGAAAPYPDVPQQADYPRIEEAVLDYWKRDGTFEASIEARSAGEDYVFYDGPPFANGLPHYGHLLTGFVKDAIPRYQTMRGRHVERRFGWDCHGLPAEMQAEKELGVSGRAGVSSIGVGVFNDHCRGLVMRTADSWERYVTRQDRWVDFVNDYKTMDLGYMESVMWAFRTLYDKGLIYEGERVLPYCWECETPLSNFETRQDDAYRDREDPAVTVAFDLDPLPAGASGAGGRSSDATRSGNLSVLEGPLRLLVWTTTPWTLPSNLAVAVGPEIVYGVYDTGESLDVIALDRAAAYEGLTGGQEPVATLRGSELVGRTYRPLFDFFADQEGAFRVLAGDFVETGEGTGIVHLAPGFGEDDHDLCVEEGIPVVCPVDSTGRFTPDVPDYAGIQVFEANERIISDLDARGALVGREAYVHSYPHCWRSDTPLIYRSLSSWFVAVTRLKESMLELNATIDWVPAHVRDGAFGKWLEAARDWSISRNRFWGAPIPVWTSDDPLHPRTDVYGSLAELERDFGVRPRDLHRPAIDELTRPNPDDPTGRSTMRRVPDVLDCWFESGSMPFAQVHYPFENSAWFDGHFPADFVVEYVGQTRGWFYTLHVLASALFGRPAFSHCLAHGIVLGDDGRKMSKRLGNYPEPDMVFDTWGADAMRWFLLSSPVLRGQNLVVDAKGITEVVRQVINPIWNAWYFFSLYANIDGIRARWRTDAEGLLDRYALAKAAALVDEVTSALDAYDLYGACAAVSSFIGALNNWYIRRSRDRFWSHRDGSVQVEADKADAYDTLSSVLVTLCRVTAPLLPMISEEIYRGLTGERSVHLADWPSPDELPRDPELVAGMDMVREVCSVAHAVRKANRLRARLPLARMTIAVAGSARLEPYLQLVADEVNVKKIELTDQVADFAQNVISLVPGVLGPRLGEATQEVIAAGRRQEFSVDADGQVVVSGHTLAPDEYAITLKPLRPEASRTFAADAGVVFLDLSLDEELIAEGTVRDIVRLVQNARKDAGLHVADHIELYLQVPPDIARAVEAHRDHLASQTQADSVTVSSSGTTGDISAKLADGQEISMSLTRAAQPGA